MVGPVGLCGGHVELVTLEACESHMEAMLGYLGPKMRYGRASCTGTRRRSWGVGKVLERMKTQEF